VAYLCYRSPDRRVKQRLWRRILPSLVLASEVDITHMPGNTSHGNVTGTPWRAKVEIENVVLDEFRPGIVLCRVLGS